MIRQIFFQKKIKSYKEKKDAEQVCGVRKEGLVIKNQYILAERKIRKISYK